MFGKGEKEMELVGKAGTTINQKGWTYWRVMQVFLKRHAEGR